jgi:hypothetical protein
MERKKASSWKLWCADAGDFGLTGVGGEALRIEQGHPQKPIGGDDDREIVA